MTFDINGVAYKLKCPDPTYFCNTMEYSSKKFQNYEDVFHAADKLNVEPKNVVVGLKPIESKTGLIITVVTLTVLGVIALALFLSLCCCFRDHHKTKNSKNSKKKHLKTSSSSFSSSS